VGGGEGGAGKSRGRGTGKCDCWKLPHETSSKFDVCDSGESIFAC
jgi:hypothetical protein